MLSFRVALYLESGGAPPPEPCCDLRLSIPLYSEDWSEVTLIMDRVRGNPLFENPNDGDILTFGYNACVS